MGWFRRLFGGKPEVIDLPDYAGAVPPSRYHVIRRPSMVFEYAGCIGSAARRAYEYNHPKEGEVLELWDQGVCRGRK